MTTRIGTSSLSASARNAFDHVDAFGCAGVGACETRQSAGLRPAVAARADGERNWRGVQQPIRRRADDDLSQLAVRRRTQHQRFGFELVDGFQQPAGSRPVRDLVEVDLDAVADRIEAFLCLLGRVRRQLLGVLGVFGIDTGYRGGHPRPRHHSHDRQRCLQRLRGFHREVQAATGRPCRPGSRRRRSLRILRRVSSTSSSCGAAVGMRPSPPSIQRTVASAPQEVESQHRGHPYPEPNPGVRGQAVQDPQAGGDGQHGGHRIDREP